MLSCPSAFVKTICKKKKYNKKALENLFSKALYIKLEAWLL